MLRNRLFGTFAVLAIVGLAACSGDNANEDTGAVTDTLVTTDSVTQEVQVPVQDTQAVITDVDTTRDTVPIDNVDTTRTP
jgi:hypothetical protein